MDRRPGARCRPRGGEGIQALRTAGTRLTLAALAVAAYAAVVARACVLDTRIVPVTVALGAAGGVVLVVVLVRGVEELIGSAVFLAGACYMLGLLAGRHALDDAVPLVAGGLVACAELAVWSVHERRPVRADRGVQRARAAATGGLVVGGVLVAGIVVAVAAVPAGSGLGWTVLGAAAAVLVLVLARRLAR